MRLWLCCLYGMGLINHHHHRITLVLFFLKTYFSRRFFETCFYFIFALCGRLDDILCTLFLLDPSVWVTSVMSFTTLYFQIFLRCLLPILSRRFPYNFRNIFFSMSIEFSSSSLLILFLFQFYWMWRVFIKALKLLIFVSFDPLLSYILDQNIW